jgi:hypothetical protein
MIGADEFGLALKKFLGSFGHAVPRCAPPTPRRARDKIGTAIWLSNVATWRRAFSRQVFPPGFSPGSHERLL